MYRYTKETILETVKEEFSRWLGYDKKGELINGKPGQFRIYIFFIYKTGLILFNDNPIDTLLLRDMMDEKIIKHEPGRYYHQGEPAIRYKFIGYKYPREYYRAISPELRKRVYERDNYRCYECGESRHYRLTVDHIAPWSLGGYTEFYNLQTLCKTCNSVKHNN